MTQEEIKQFLRDNLRIYADIEETPRQIEGMNKLVIQISIGREVISETKIWV